ncbi:hypothetical protein IW140_006475 [Coemansia sp. RSA 1813]|nr:hypothetical protein EV178_005516 [Coemansia sp. RSA 1646]KAJ1768074.1 hypothetical protein LPJ74_005020 [Coemansia sp. RSA 1843]KAJ2086687.1 hypothetical protein IW138_005506 [Coemansia sp. RSA 986]KAJ2210248.1 hypothetical protein EV179_006364 [Coemansia sp. RSA 487]KAJ2562128.1 hypothetical protein IW140_006475 [Coemansia sp. RSA 1813]
MTATQVLTQEIRQLLECDLGESALQLAELECKPRLTDRRLPSNERLHLLRAYCDCLDAQKQHRTSLRVITEFISGPVRGQLTADELEDVARDIASQRWRLGEHDLCLAQLRQIPRTHRTVKDVARMARCAALIRSPDATDLFSELLKRQPNASEALAYVNAHAENVKSDGNSYHDVVSLAKAQSMMQRLDYRGANDELSRLARRHPESAQIRAHQATCRYMLNDVSTAHALYERARVLDPSLMDQMGVYSCLLAASADAHAVYQLGNELLKVDQARAEGWVAMARYFLLSGETQEALAIAWRAQTLAPDFADAYYAEGVIQMASGSVEDALDVFTKAHQLGKSAHTYRAVVEALVQCGRYKEAFVHAREMAELLPRHASALAMVGVVLSHSPESSEKAMRLLEAAIELDKRCAEAVGALASLHVANGRLEDAVRVLEDHLPDMQTDDMYTRYADVLTLANELPKAAVNYTAALTINPQNERARVGMDRVDKLMHPNESGEFDEEEEDEERVEDPNGVGEPVDAAIEEDGMHHPHGHFLRNPDDAGASSPGMLEYDELGTDRGAGSSGGLFY